MSSTRRISIFGIALGPGQTKVPNAAGEFLESNYKPGEAYGADERGFVLVKLDNGAWKYLP